MGLRIRTNVASLTAQRNLGTTTSRHEGSMERLSSGYRINKSADDAAGLAISEQMRGTVRSLEQSRRNANDGVSMIQVAEGRMNEVSNILIRLRELATQAASDTVSNRERAFTNREYVQLVDEIDRIANTTEFNGVKLLRGARENAGAAELTFHVGAGDGSKANTDTIKFDFDSIRIDSREVLNLGKGSEIGPQNTGDRFNREAAAQKLTTIDNAISTIASNRATLGSNQSRLMSTINNLGIQVENMNTSMSRIRDVDFADETAQFTQLNILRQAGTSVLTQANQAPELALGLLR